MAVMKVTNMLMPKLNMTKAERDGPSVVVLGGLPTAIGGSVFHMSIYSRQLSKLGKFSPLTNRYSHDSHIYQVTGESYDPTADSW